MSARTASGRTQTAVADQKLQKYEQAFRQIAEVCSKFGAGADGSKNGSVGYHAPDYDSGLEVYHAQEGGAVAAATAAAASAFTIEVRFLGGLTENQKQAFRGAADRWSRVIVGSLPAVQVDNDVTSGVIILAQGANIDGVGHILGQAGPTALRPSNAGAAAYLPAKGVMTFDTADLASMEANGTLRDVITHEMGHVLGIGTVWTYKSLLKNAGTVNPVFVGSNARREYGLLRGQGPLSVPVENTGGVGTRDSHWRDLVFRNELMTGFVNIGGNPMSRVTVASLQDLGYEVDMDAAEAYQLPNLLNLVESGGLPSISDAPANDGVLISIPLLLPSESLV